MKKIDRTDIHYTSRDATWPSGLKTATEISELLGIDAKRLLSLADAQYCPHWRIDGGEPMFQLAEIKRWAAQNLLRRIEGQELPISLRIMIDAPPATDAPAAIREIKNLRHMQNADYPPGVYFLVHDADEIVYVGQSIQPLARLSTHRNHKTFTKAYLLPVPSYALDQVEGALIRLLKPKLNYGSRSNCEKRILHAPGNKAADRKTLNQIGITLNADQNADQAMCKPVQC